MFISDIRAAREAAGLSRGDVLKRLGIPICTLADWETGRYKPSNWVKGLVIAEFKRIASSKYSNGDQNR